MSRSLLVFVFVERQLVFLFRLLVNRLGLPIDDRHPGLIRQELQETLSEAFGADGVTVGRVPDEVLGDLDLVLVLEVLLGDDPLLERSTVVLDNLS